jgi:hypothetical protein
MPGFQLSGWPTILRHRAIHLIATAFWCETKNTFYRLLKLASAERKHRQSKPNGKILHEQ